MRLGLVALCLLVLSAERLLANECGDETACHVDSGSYYISMPPDWDGDSDLAAVVFFHGHRGSGRQVIRNQGLIGRFHAAGYAVVAPEGAERPSRQGELVRGWPGRVSTGQSRDDLVYLREVMTSVSAQWPIQWKESLVTGFSSGGSMAWLVACHMGSEFAGYAPIAGALRHPRHERGCETSPVRLLHIHGFADKQVPIEGRGIGNWHQGDVFESMSLARRKNGCRSQPDEISTDDPFRCRSWNACESGFDLRLCLHDGGHGLPKSWSELVLDWFKTGRTANAADRN